MSFSPSSVSSELISSMYSLSSAKSVARPPVATTRLIPLTSCLMRARTIAMRRALAVLMLAAASTALGSQVMAPHAAVATSSPLATQIGVRVLKDGGSAADAAVAVALLIGVAQPESSGIGGGGMLTYYEAKTGAIWTLDFLSTAPAGVKPDMAGTRLGVKAVGTPGFLAGLDVLHRKFGVRPWKADVGPAIVLARETGKKELTATLQRISDAGARDFYDGELGNHIASK